MPKFSVNLTMLFGESPFLERFAAARGAGFRYVEYMFPYDHEAGTLGRLLRDNGLRQVLFNFPVGDWGKGDRGIATDPRRIDEFREGVGRAAEYARALDVPCVNCLGGKAVEGIPHEEQWRVLVENLRHAAGELARDGRTCLVEAINTYDIPGFFLNNTRDGLKLLDAVGADNLKLQYDAYHMQRMEGNLTETIRANLPSIGHIQIADNPGRHQPGTGEINYGFLLRELDLMGYTGYVGLEYLPAPDTASSLSWLKETGFTP